MNNHILAVAIFLIVTVIGSALYLTSSSVNESCIASLEARFNYMERKLCDPMSEEVCAIDPELQTELGDWYERELVKCK